MHLSAIGKFAQDQIHHTAAIRDGDVSIPQYTVMPNHIHMIIVIRRRRDALNASLEPNAECTRMDAQTMNTRTMDARGMDAQTMNARRMDARGASLRRYHRNGDGSDRNQGICRQKKWGANGGAPFKIIFLVIYGIL